MPFYAQLNICVGIGPGTKRELYLSRTDCSVTVCGPSSVYNIGNSDLVMVILSNFFLPFMWQNPASHIGYKYKFVTVLYYSPTTPVADPETSEKGGQETWNISHHARWPSFLWLFFTGRGGGGHGRLGPLWIHYCTLDHIFRRMEDKCRKRLLRLSCALSFGSLVFFIIVCVLNLKPYLESQDYVQTDCVMVSLPNKKIYVTSEV